MLIHASREQHRVSSGSINEPYLVDPVELEVGEHAEGAVLSSRTACSGAFCTSKHHQSIMSSIQRHVGGAIRQPAAALRTSWRAQILRDSSAVWPLLRAPASAIGVRRRGRTEIKCRASGWDGAVLLTFREGFRSPVKASAATRPCALEPRRELTNNPSTKPPSSPAFSGEPAAAWALGRARPSTEQRARPGPRLVSRRHAHRHLRMLG